MPVSLSEWRVRIGTFRCRRWKEYDFNNFLRKLDNLIKRTKNAESPKENKNPEYNISSPTGSSDVANSSGVNTDLNTASLYKDNINTAQTGPSCDINNSTGNINSQIQAQCDVKIPGKKGTSTSHCQSLCAKAKETDPGPDFTEVQNPVTNPCEEDELDNRYITIHQKSHEYPTNSTEGSKADQSDLSIIGMNNHSPAAVGDGPVLGLESTRPPKEDTSNSAPSGIEDQSSGSSRENGQDTMRNAEQITPIEKCHGSETYPVLGSGPTSDEADDIKDIDCPDMTKALLLRSGDVELNPGPNDTESVSDVKLNALAAHIPPDKYHDLSEELGIECNVTPFTLQNHGGNNKQEMRERLFAWKSKTGGSFTELKRICNSVLLGEIAETYLGKTVSTSPRLSASSTVDIPPQDASTGAGEGSSSRASDEVSDVRLNALAAHVHPGKYYRLSLALDIGYNEAANILAHNRGYYRQAIRQSFYQWKCRTGGSCTELKRIFKSVHLGGIADIYLEKIVFVCPRSSFLFPPEDLSAADGHVTTSRASDTVSDSKLDTLGAHVPHDKYHELSSQLGFTYTVASNLLRQHGGYSKAAIIQCLFEWKKNTGGSLTELKRNCYSVQLGGIAETYLGTTVSASPRTSASASANIHLQDASTAVGEVFNSTAGDTVSDVKLNAFAAHVPPDKCHDLSIELGIEYNEASQIIQQHHGSITAATRECLFVWKNKTGGSLTELKRICNDAHLGEIAMTYLGKTVSASSRPSASTSVDIFPQDTSSAAGEVSTYRASDTVSNVKLEIIAANVPHDKYYDLSIELGFEYNEASHFMQRHLGSATAGMRECLIAWRNKTGGSLTELERSLNSCHLGGITEGYLDKTVSASPRPSASTSVAISPQDASAAAGDISASQTRFVLSIDEQHADKEIDPEEAIRNGMAPWNRSRIMVIGPGGVGKTSLIRRLTGQKFNPEEKSTKGAEQNVVTQSAVSSWILVNDAKTAKGDLIQSIATMEDSNFGSNTSCSTGGKENRSDPAITTKGDQIQSMATLEDVNIGSNISCSTGGEETRSDPKTTERRGVEHKNDQETIADSGIGHVEEPTESKMIQNRDGNGSTPGKGNMSEAAEDKSSVKVLPTIAKISQGITREEITKVKSSAIGITYSMWDFGGQEIYYITHPLFLSWRSLYILVIPLHLELSDKAPREEDALKQLKGSPVRTPRTILELVDFWLMSVYTHAVRDSNHEPKVLLIGTFAGDEGPGIIQEKVTAKSQELEKRLGSKPYWKQVLSPMCGIDNQFSPRSEVEKIQERIDGLVKDSAYMKVLMPIKWRTYLSAIEDSDQNTLTVEEADKTMTTFEINGDKEVKAVLKFYHDIGHLIYHQGCELVVLKPQFLNNIVSNIITVIDDEKMKGDRGEYWRDLKEKGILNIELIQAVWKKHKGHHDQLNDIINMMIMFDLICEIPDRPDGRRFFVPCRSSSMLDEKECHFKDDKVEFIIDFNHFLPDGFLHRFYVRMAKWSMERKKSIKPTFHCRQMMFYIDNRHRVVMTNEIHSEERHQIKVTIYAVAPAGTPSERTQTRVSLNKNIIDHLHDTLEDLKMLWARRIEYSVGILCPKCSEHGGTTLIPIRDILKDQDVDGLASCDDGCPVYVGDILKAFSKGTKLSWEKQGDSSIGVHVDAANSSSVTGNTFIGQQNITKHSLYSHGSGDDSLGEPSTSTKRDKKTNPKSDSTTNEDKITRRDKQTMSDGSEDDSFDGRPRKRKKKTDRRTDSGDEDGRSRGDKRTFEHVHLGISEMELHNLAEKLGNHTNLQKFALKLGFSYERWMQFKASNTRRDGRICSEGTFGMLIDWKNDTLQVSQKELLNEALIFAGFAEFAETKHQMEN